MKQIISLFSIMTIVIGCSTDVPISSINIYYQSKHLNTMTPMKKTYQVLKDERFLRDTIIVDKKFIRKIWNETKKLQSDTTKGHYVDLRIVCFMNMKDGSRSKRLGLNYYFDTSLNDSIMIDNPELTKLIRNVIEEDEKNKGPRKLVPDIIEDKSNNTE